MALPNGVLVHGPTSWACAIRHADGTHRGRVGAEALPRLARVESVPPRPGPARRGARAAAAGEAASSRARSCRCRARVMLASMIGAAVAVKAIRESGACVPLRRSCSPACSRSRRRRSRCAAPSSPRITVRSTSRSARTSTAPVRRRSTSAAAVIWSARSSRRRRSATCSRGSRPSACAAGARCRAVRCARRVDGDLRLDDAASRRISSRRRCRSPATSSSTGSRRPSRRTEQLEVAEAALAACLELEAWRRRR